MFFEKLAGDNKNSVKSPPYCTVAVVHPYQWWKLVEPWIRSEAFSRLKYEQSANCQIPSNLYFEHVAGLHQVLPPLVLGFCKGYKFS